MKTIILVLLLAAPASAQSTGVRLALGGLVVGNVLDIVSTEKAIASGHGREGNPLMGQSQTQRFAVKAATTITSVWLLKKIGKSRPKTAQVIAWTLTGGLTYIASRNMAIAEGKP